MRRILTAAVLLLCFLLDGSAAQAQADPVDEVIQRVNSLRSAYGVPAYQVDYALMYAAQAHAEWGLANTYFGHDGPGGSMPDDRARAAGYGSGENVFAIENVAAGTASLNTPELVVTMWQGDWGHLNAMISADYEHIGVGFAEANDFSYYVMMVGWVGSKASSGDSQEQAYPEFDTISEPFSVSEPDSSGAIYHEVQAGQSAWTIAAKYGITLAELFEINQLSEDSILLPGDVLLIRPPDPPTSTPTTTLYPTKTPPEVQATAAATATDTPSAHNQEDVPAQSAIRDANAAPLVAGVGLALLVCVFTIMRLRKP